MTTLVIFYESIIFCCLFSLRRITRAITAPVSLSREIRRKNPVYDAAGIEAQQLSGVRKWTDAITDLLFLKEFLKHKPWFWLPIYPFYQGVNLRFAGHLILLTESLTGPYGVNSINNSTEALI